MCLHVKRLKVLYLCSQENLQKNEKFANFIQEEENRPEMRGLKLGALLITPVQRIPRYVQQLWQNYHLSIKIGRKLEFCNSLLDLESSLKPEPFTTYKHAF